jgi:hypothetical protein
MTRRLLRADGTPSTAARALIAGLVAVAFLAGVLVRASGGDDAERESALLPTSRLAGEVGPGPAAGGGPALRLSRTAAIPRLRPARRPRAVAKRPPAAPTVAPRPAARPARTPRPSPEPSADAPAETPPRSPEPSAAPPVSTPRPSPAPPAATPAPAAPPPGEIFDSSG